MSAILVRGMKSLKGEIKIQGSKNAALPIMAAAILHDGITVINNVPSIDDVFCMKDILEFLGCKCIFEKNVMQIDASVVNLTDIPEHYVKSMRSSIIVLGALLARCGIAATYYPGGCSIGKRPVDLHLHALRRLGAFIKEENDFISASCKELTGARIHLSFPSVGATENALLAAVGAAGITEIYGYAREPEIEQLCEFLICMGADISGFGEDCIKICGHMKLHDCEYSVKGDRIAAGTYLAAALATKGELYVSGIIPKQLSGVCEKFEAAGAVLKTGNDYIKLCMDKRPEAFEIKTGPYPEFPTDMQSPFMTIMSIANGSSRIEENIFEGRYKTAQELEKLGARIRIDGSMAYIDGVYMLDGAEVTACDLRGGAALVIAGLCAGGSTRINDCEHILRGYEDICRDLSSAGGSVVYAKG